MKSQLLAAITIAFFILTSCGNYHNKIRFNKVKTLKKEMVESNDSEKDQENISFEDDVKLEKNIETMPSQEVYSESITAKKSNRDSSIDTDEDGLSEVDDDQLAEAVGESAPKVEERKVLPMAIAGLVASSISIAFAITTVITFFTSPIWIVLILALFLIGLILSIASLVKIRRNPDSYKGKGIAVAGIGVLVVGLIALLLLLGGL
ncbi:MAG: hypothetical protein ACJASQ_004186 [Crocinitomicaceae bacterium]|jgi:hypothetical protein